MKIRSILFAGLVCTLGLASFGATAAEDALQTILSINVNRAKLVGQTVTTQGKVVKVLTGIMHRNFIHVMDGTGDANTGDLIVTSQQRANVGDQVTVSGVLVLDRDFGSGYVYPLLLENATIVVKK
jgi:uncharacterized protein YycO